MHGTITSVENHGTIVSVWVTADKVEPGKRPFTIVHFDHRMFQHLVDARGVTKLDDLVGQGVTYEDEGGAESPTLAFDDEQ